MTPERKIPRTRKTFIGSATLGAALRRIRGASGWSQEAMARQIGIAAQTESRFERGKQVPRASKTLSRIADIAKHFKLVEECDLFRRAALDATPHQFERVPESSERGAETGGGKPPRPSSPHEWRVAQIARLSARFFPEEARLIETVAPTAAALVDAALGENAAAERPQDYAELESRLDALAELKAFMSFKKEPQ